MKTLLLAMIFAGAGWAQEPVASVWLVNQSSPVRVRPEVHSVTVTEKEVEVRSAGVSTVFFGPLQTPAAPVERARLLRFRIPRMPVLARGDHTSVRPDAVGVFVNGVPISNRFEAASYHGRNLWHYDPIAGGDDGTWTAAGHPRVDAHGFSPGLLERLISDASGHSPILGFAFDGHPIYGPWAYANEAGGLRRMRSSYRLRRIAERTTWPDGTRLLPGQYGPAVDAQYPLGAFVEDYEYVPGAGDLDEFNGRFAKTPEYPNGTYAYFLTTDEAGRLAFPYLLAGKYAGRVTAESLAAAVREDGEAEDSPSVAGGQRAAVSTVPAGARLMFWTDASPTAGRPVRLRFQARDECGRAIRFLEFVHERPLHLIVVSEDLAEFDHVHPELTAGDAYELRHTFRHGGRYRLYADFTPPGGAQRIEVFDLTLAGAPRPAIPLTADRNWTRRTEAAAVTLASDAPLRAGEDVTLRFTLRDPATDAPLAGLEPYLGAWAHFVLLDENKRHFIHAHPLEAAAAPDQPHTHDARSLGPPPDEIRVLTSFPAPGLYKLWAQFQRDGQVIVQPFVLRVDAPREAMRAAVAVPADAVRLAIGAGGFSPAVLRVDAGRPFTLAVTRDAQPNCGNRIVFPSLGISRDLPLGETVLLELPALPKGELRFTCGMSMYKGAIVVP